MRLWPAACTGLAWTADQYFTLPEAQKGLLSSAMKPITEPVAALIKLAKGGAYPTNGAFVGPSGYAPFHDLDSVVPAEVKTEMEALLKGLTDGSIKTNVPPVKPAS